MNTTGKEYSFEQPVNGKTAWPYEFPSFVAGDCNFEKPLAACGYSQGRDDDLDWEQVNTREKPPSDLWLPSGKDGGMTIPSVRFNSPTFQPELYSSQWSKTLLDSDLDSWPYEWAN